MHLKASTQSFFLLLLCMVVAAPAQSKGHRTHYREHGERIDVYSYAKWGRLHVVLKNYNRKYTVNYTLSGRGSVRLNDDSQGPGFVTYEGITDTSGGYYRSADPVRYAADSLIGAERIYVSKVENDL